MITPTSKFVVVTKPWRYSTIADICFITDLAGLELQFKGGLTAANIVGLYSLLSDATAAAETLIAERDAELEPQ